MLGVHSVLLDSPPPRPKKDAGFKSIVCTLLVSGLGLVGKIWVDVSGIEGRLIKLETLNVVTAREIDGLRGDIKDLTKSIRDDQRMGYKR
jgi:hypothetical protein